MNPFYEEIYRAVRQIPSGKVATYGQIAFQSGKPRAARQVGYALHACKDPTIPCHRVVNRSGRLAPGFLAQRTLLEREGIAVDKHACVDLKKYQAMFFNFKI